MKHEVGKKKRPREVTKLDLTRISKTRNTETLENSLSVGSKHRLRNYRKNLSVTRGKNDVLFDSEVLKVLQRYALNPESLQFEREYLNHVRDEEGNLFSRNLKEYAKISKNLEEFSKSDHSSFRWNQNYQKSLEELRNVFRRAHLKPLDYKCDDDIIQAIPKANTHSGWTWIESGNKKKGDNMDGIYSRYVSHYASMLESGTLEKPVLIGFRTQASGEYEDDGSRTGTCKHKTRMICMVDLIQIVFELKYAKPLQKFLAGLECYAGGEDPNVTSSKIRSWQRRYQTWYSLDYSSFDMTISSWLIEDAFSILREAFRFVDDAEWSCIVHDFIHKDFVVNECIVHADKGVPSGSMFTQIIDSVVNLLAVMTYFNSIGEKCEMITMGDDNLVFSNLPCTEEAVKLLSTYINKNFGLIINPTKSVIGRYSEPPTFLSRYWRLDGQWRHPNSLISRMLFPERYRDYSGEVTPEVVVFAFILTYPLGMKKLINVPSFLQDNPISRKYVLDTVDSQYVPGSLAFARLNAA